MTATLTAFRVGAVLALLVGVVAPAPAQPAASYPSGAAFYTAYRAAFAKAKTIDELLPWMGKESRDQVAATPAGERAQMFGMIKAMDDHTGIKVLKETPSATGAELQVEATSASSKGKATGTITLVKEGGAWRLSGESWKSGL